MREATSGVGGSEIVDSDGGRYQRTPAAFTGNPIGSADEGEIIASKI